MIMRFIYGSYVKYGYLARFKFWNSDVDAINAKSLIRPFETFD